MKRHNIISAKKTDTHIETFCTTPELLKKCKGHERQRMKKRSKWKDSKEKWQIN